MATSNFEIVSSAQVHELSEQKVNQTDMAPVENGNTASQNYSVGVYVTWKGTTYRVKAAIASGDSFVIGTNLETLPDGVINSLCGSLNPFNKMLNYNNWQNAGVNTDLSNYTWIYLAFVDASNEVSEPTIIPVSVFLNAATRFNVKTSYVTINGSILNYISPAMQVLVC